MRNYRLRPAHGGFQRLLLGAAALFLNACGALINTGSINDSPTMSTYLIPYSGNASVTISWQAVSGAISYNIFYSQNPVFERSAATKISGSSISRVIEGLTPGLSYYFVLTAVSRSGAESAPSQIATATPNWDDESLDYFARVTAANSGTDPLTNASKLKVNAFILGLKANNLWTVMDDAWLGRSSQNVGSGSTVVALKESSNDATLVNGPVFHSDGLRFAKSGGDVYMEMNSALGVPATAGSSVTLHRFNSATAANATLFTYGVNRDGRQFAFGRSAGLSYAINTNAGIWQKNVNHVTNFQSFSYSQFALVSIKQLTANTASAAINKNAFDTVPYDGTAGVVWTDIPHASTFGIFTAIGDTSIPSIDFAFHAYFSTALSDNDKDALYDLLSTTIGSDLGMP